MGLEDDGDAAAGGGKAGSSIPCSICLEDVTDYGDRAWAKLHCGHQFHLDCIGSAFNVKGVMQCPNCRKLEKGQWLYADGGRPYPEINIDDLVNEEDLYDLSYSESSMWCPYDGYTAFDEVEFPTSAYHDTISENATTVSSSSATHICPYIAYVHPSTQNMTPQESRFDSNNNNNIQWNTQSVSSEIPTSYALHYHTTLFPTPTTRLPDVHHSSISMPHRQRTNADVSRSRSYAHPFLAGQSSSGTRPPSSSTNRGYTGTGSSARAGERAHTYLQQPMHAIGPQRSNGQGSDQTRHGGGGVYYSGLSTGRSFQESERSVLNLFHHIWERDPDPPHQHPVSVERVPFHQAAGGGGGGFRERHGAERMPSHSQSRYWL